MRNSKQEPLNTSRRKTILACDVIIFYFWKDKPVDWRLDLAKIATLAFKLGLI